MKKCKGCGDIKKYSEFHKKSDSKDGHRAKCKTCRALEGKEYRNKPGKKEMAGQRVSMWRKTKKGRESSRKTRGRYNQTEHGKELNKGYSAKYRVKNPLIIKAQKALWWAVKSGRIDRPSKCACCCIKCIPHGHHESYKKEDWLRVDWLCYICHSDLHMIVGNSDAWVDEAGEISSEQFEALKNYSTPKGAKVFITK